MTQKRKRMAASRVARTLTRALGIGVMGVTSLVVSQATRALDHESKQPAFGSELPDDQGPLLFAPRLATLPDENQDARHEAIVIEASPPAEESLDSLREEETAVPDDSLVASPKAADEEAAPAPPDFDRAPRPVPPDQSSQSRPESGAPSLPELSPELAKLRDRMKACAEYYSQRPENSADRDPWSVMHALIGYGADTEILVGSRRVNAIGWLLWNGSCRGKQLLYLDKGRLAAHVGKPGTQGHAGQFLAMLAQWNVLAETPMKIQGRDFTVADFIEYEKRTCEPKSELTFKLIALSYYLDSDATWTDDRGRPWSIPRLIEEELAQPVIGAACGGTHRMMGFSYAIRMRQRDGKPLDGQWERARRFVDDYHEYALGLLNADGSFSTRWFAGRGDSGDLDRRIQTTGHVFEWLAYSLPEDQLFDPRMVRMADYLTETMIQHRARKWEIGPRGHAIHGLNLYLDRAFDTKAEYLAPEIARQRNAGKQR